MHSILRRTLPNSFRECLAASTRRRVLKSECLQYSAAYFSRHHHSASLNRTSPTSSRNSRYFTHAIRNYSSQITDIVFPDPHRPDLFYHLVYPPTPLSITLPAFALSFLDKSPPSVDSPTVIGWLPAETYETDQPEPAEGQNQREERTAGLNDFVQNDKFVQLLHESIKEGLAANVDQIWKDKALGLQSGWMHIHDQRNIPPLERIGDPDDIIATVLVHDSQIVVDTYQPMPAYRVCTADGVMQLTPGLSDYLHKKLLDLATSGPMS